MSSSDATTANHSYVDTNRVERPFALQTLTSYRFGGVPTVTILVGENSTPFSIHRDQLCEASSFFKAAFQGNFLEGSEMRMRLPEEEKHTFELFIEWLYNRSYEICNIEDEAEGEGFMEPIKLYILADKYDVTVLKSHVITQLFALRNEKWVPDSDTVAYAYVHTPRSSHLRKFLADWWACQVDLAWFRSEEAQEWFEEHPEVASAVISSFASTMSRETQKDLFGDAVEEYEDAPSNSE